MVCFTLLNFNNKTIDQCSSVINSNKIVETPIFEITAIINETKIIEKRKLSYFILFLI